MVTGALTPVPPTVYVYMFIVVYNWMYIDNSFFGFCTILFKLQYLGTTQDTLCHMFYTEKSKHKAVWTSMGLSWLDWKWNSESLPGRCSFGHVHHKVDSGCKSVS